MSKEVEKLNENAIRYFSYKEDEKRPKCVYQSLADGNGLTLRVYRKGSRSWYLTYRFGGKVKHLFLGSYPEMTLTKAREETVKIRQKIKEGIDPIAEKVAAKEAEDKEAENARYTFGAVYAEWAEKELVLRRERTQRQYRDAVDRVALPALQDTQVSKVTRLMLTETLKAATCAYSTVSVAATALRLIFRYAEDSGYIDASPAESLTRVFKQPPRKQHFAATTDPKGIGEILRKIDEFCTRDDSAGPQVRLVMRLLPILAMRITALCGLQWNDIDLESGTINVAARDGNKTKTGYTVYVPPKSLALLREYAKVRLNETYVFPGRGGGSVTDCAIKLAFWKAGINLKEQSLHGWRQVLKTVASEAGVPALLTEKALGHVVGSAIENTYNRAGYATALRAFWQWYENVLYTLRDGTEPPQWDGEKWL